MLSQPQNPLAAVADSLVSTALVEISEVLVQRDALFLCATADLENLAFSAFRSIQAVLHDAEGKQVASSKVGTAAYDLNEFLDDPLILGFQDGGGHVVGTVGKEVLANLLVCQIRKIGVRLNGIADDDSDCSFSVGCRSGGDGMLGGSRLPTILFVESCELIGREVGKQIIIRQLVSRSRRDEQLCVVIVNGIGETFNKTVANGIFGGKMVQAFVNDFLWGCVTENFDILRTTRPILEDLGIRASSCPQKNSIEALEGKMAFPCLR